MKNRLPISVCLISGAERSRIGRALESVEGWTREIIVVLNEDVTDGTDLEAERFGARVFREPWKGHVAQKNSARQKATQEWVLGLDADEVVSRELREEIALLFAEGSKAESFAAFSFPRMTFFCGRWIRHGEWYPDRGTRLWRQGQAEWGGVDPHDKLLVRGAVGRLHGKLLHFNAAGIDEQIAKISRYSDDFCANALAKRQRVTWIDLAVRPGWRFIRGYFLKLGFLDGWQGYYIASMTAFYTVTRYCKVRETQTRNEAPPTANTV